MNRLLALQLAALLFLRFAGSEQPAFAGKPPKPELTQAEFAAELQEVFYQESPANVQSITLNNENEKQLILNNLAHLPGLNEVEFDRVPLSRTELSKLAGFPNVTRIGFRRYKSIDFSLLTSLNSLKEFSVSRCSRVAWRELITLSLVDGPKLSALRLHETSISGDEIRALGNVPSLASLEFSSCDGLQDSDLQHLVDWHGLRSLSIYNCPDVKGEFLKHFGDSAELRELNFTGVVSAEHLSRLASLPKLENLWLNIEQPLEDEWYIALAKNCKQLKTLSLQRQGVNRRRLEAIRSLRELEELHLHSGSQYAGLPGRRARVSSNEGIFESLTDLSKLKKLRISGSYRLSAMDGDAITSLPLVELELRDVTLGEGVFENLGRLSDLQTLVLQGSRGLSKSDSEQLGKLTNLRTLNMANLSSSGADLSHLKGLENLRELDLSDYRSLNDNDMVFAEGMSRLEKITLANSFRVTDKGLAHLGKASNVKELTITKLGIKGTGFGEWPDDHQVESLFIEGCSISNEGLRGIARLQNLENLDIRVTRLFGGAIEVDASLFAAAKSLQSVSLLGSYVTSQEQVDKLIEARPDIFIRCSIRRQ